MLERAALTLDRSFAGVVSTIENGVDATGQRWLGDLLEHETQHHGQLIRYIYALDIPRPPSWRERYALD